jgi:hypothetical protein
MKSKVVGHVVRMLLFKVLTKKIVKNGGSQFQNFHVNFQKFHALFITRLSHLGYAIIIIIGGAVLSP